MAVDLRPLTLAELLDRSFTTYKRYVWVFAGIMAVPGVLGLVAAVLMQFAQFWMGGTAPAEGSAPDISLETLLFKVLPAFAGAMLFIGVYFVAYTFALGATTVAVARIYNDQPVSLAESYRAVRPQGWRLLGLLIWATVRVGLVWFGLVVATGLLSALSSLLSPLLAPLVFIAGFLVAMLAGGYFAVRYGVCVPAAVVESLSPNAAIKRSVTLTENHRGRIFLILLCAVVITYATALLLQAPFMIGAMVVGPETSTALVLNVIGAVLGTAGSLFTGPIMIIGLAMAYYDLRIRKEALDLQIMLDSLDAPRA